MFLRWQAAALGVDQAFVCEDLTLREEQDC